MRLHRRANDGGASLHPSQSTPTVHIIIMTTCPLLGGMKVLYAVKDFTTPETARLDRLIFAPNSRNR